MYNFSFSKTMVISAEIVMFLRKVVYFGRNKTISAEIRQIRPNIRFRPNFGFCEGPVSVFGVSAKNLFRSNTSEDVHDMRAIFYVSVILTILI